MNKLGSPGRSWWKTMMTMTEDDDIDDGRWQWWKMMTMMEDNNDGRLWWNMTMMTEDEDDGRQWCSLAQYHAILYRLMQSLNSGPLWSFWVDPVQFPWINNGQKLFTWQKTTEVFLSNLEQILFLFWDTLYNRSYIHWKKILRVLVCYHPSFLDQSSLYASGSNKSKEIGPIHKITNKSMEFKGWTLNFLSIRFTFYFYVLRFTYILPFTFYVLPSTFYILSFIFYLLPFTFYLLPLTFDVSCFTFYVLPLTLFLLPFNFLTFTFYLHPFTLLPFYRFTLLPFYPFTLFWCPWFMVDGW